MHITQCDSQEQIQILAHKIRLFIDIFLIFISKRNKKQGDCEFVLRAHL